MRMGCLPLLLRKKFWPRPHPLSRGLKTRPKMTKTGITSKIFVRLTQIWYQLIGIVVVHLLLKKKIWLWPHPFSRALKTHPKMTKTSLTLDINSISRLTFRTYLCTSWLTAAVVLSGLFAKNPVFKVFVMFWLKTS